MSESQNVSLKKAAMINASGKYIKVVLTLVVNAILARILSPYDFGVVAVITVFTTFFSTLSDMGLGPAIVQKKDLSSFEIDSLFTYSIYVSVVLSLVFVLCAFPIAAFYKDAVYLKPAMLLSVALFFNAVNMVPNGILSRDKKFVTIALRTVAVYVLSAAVAICLALNGWRFYALVVQAILASFLQFVWNWISARPHFVLHPSRTVVSKVRTYSSYQLAFNVVNYFARNLDNLLTGKFMGEVNLGNYNKAYGLMLFPVNNLSGVISPVLHPILSDYQNDTRVIYVKYMRLVRFLFCLGIITAAFAWLAADEIIAVLYGPQWGSCAECFRLLSIAIIPQMINASAGAVFQSLGNTKHLFASTSINTAVTLTAILAGIFLGGDIASLSLLVALSYVIHFAVAFYVLVRKTFAFPLGPFVRELLPEWVMTYVMVQAVCFYPFCVDGVLASLAVKTAYVVVVYALCMLLSGEYKLFKLW